MVLPERGHVTVDLPGTRVRAVDVGVDHRAPVVGQLAGEFTVDPVVHQRDRARQDQRRPVVALPQRRDHGCHEPQHATGALESIDGRPVLVEPVEDLGVDRVGGLDAFDVGDLGALGREVGALAAVQLAERLGSCVTIGDSVGIERLEEPTTDDLEALVALGRLPLLGLASDDVGQAVQRLSTGDAADLEARRRCFVVRCARRPRTLGSTRRTARRRCPEPPR